MKIKSCTKKCLKDCQANRANHIPHEHFIMALSFLVIALSGIITTVHSVEAKAPVKKRVVYTSSCVDPDKRNIATKGTTALVKYNKLNRADSTTIKSNTDTCVNATSIREYTCTKGKITSFVSRCPASHGCFNGACVARVQPQTATTIAALTTSTTPPTTTPQATLAAPDNSIIIGSDGTWCNLRSSPSSIYFAPTSCEDGTGKKVVSTCGGDNLSTYTCDYQYDGTNYKDVKCKQYVQPCSWMGAQCSANQCKLTEGQTTLPNTTFSCGDSDDGRFEDLKGTISITNNQGEVVNTVKDSCASESSVKEHFCSSNSVERYSSTTITCESGICSDGACVTFTSP